MAALHSQRLDTAPTATPAQQPKLGPRLVTAVGKKGAESATKSAHEQPVNAEAAAVSTPKEKLFERHLSYRRS